MTNKKLPHIFDTRPEPKQKTVILCSKCGNEMQVLEEHYLDYKKEKSQPLNFLCSDCTHNEIIEKELQLEKEIISKLDINPEKKYSTENAAKRLGICTATVRREIERGKIKAETGKGKIKPRYSILGKELIKYAKTRHKQQGSAHTSLRKRFFTRIRENYP